MSFQVIASLFSNLSLIFEMVFCYACSSSDSKESASNAGDRGLIPGLGRSPGEGN